MVRGLDRFKEHFADFKDRYVLIGGTASTIALEAADLEFRATKDLDIVLCVEALDRALGEAFWDFIQQGQYDDQRHSTVEKRFYRFDRPRDETFPETLELFSRLPDVLQVPEGSHLTPLPVDEVVSSLSAILLDDAYYAFIHEGRREVDGLSVLGADRLIPLKAFAWIRLQQLRAEGVSIQRQDVNKHRADVFRLLQVLAPEEGIVLPTQIRRDMESFLKEVRKQGGVDPKALGLGKQPLEALIERLEGIYGLDR